MSICVSPFDKIKKKCLKWADRARTRELSPPFGPHWTIHSQGLAHRWMAGKCLEFAARWTMGLVPAWAASLLVVHWTPRALRTKTTQNTRYFLSLEITFWRMAQFMPILYVIKTVVDHPISPSHGQYSILNAWWHRPRLRGWPHNKAVDLNSKMRVSSVYCLLLCSPRRPL